ncbi:MAG TPA: lysophospholipid acyltransferase family protein [Aridibacter sp.]|nr:lysophospholipid acyltransferase family protein [Aridibacter sp.]
MLKAAKSKWFESLFAVYNTNLLRRRFHSFRFRGLEHLADPRPPEFPLIIYANHTSWWDGLAAFQISRAAGLDAFVMMEERHLRRFFLFRKLGAFSVVREDPRSAYRSLEYGAGLLKEEPARSLWLFPQGEIVPAASRPLCIYPGIAKLVELAGDCRVLPLVFSYKFEGEFEPSIYARAGVPQAVGAEAIPSVGEFEERMVVLLDELEGDIVAKDLGGYEELI